MIDNELSQRYKQAVDDLKITFKEIYLYRLYEKIVMRLNRVLSK